MVGRFKGDQQPQLSTSAELSPVILLNVRKSYGLLLCASPYPSMSAGKPGPMCDSSLTLERDSYHDGAARKQAPSTNISGIVRDCVCCTLEARAGARGSCQIVADTGAMIEASRLNCDDEWSTCRCRESPDAPMVLFQNYDWHIHFTLSARLSSFCRLACLAWVYGGRTGTVKHGAASAVIQVEFLAHVFG